MLHDLSNIRTLDDIQLFYFKYKDSSVFGLGGVCLLMIIGVCILWMMVLPQTQDLFSIQSNIKETQERISQLKTNQSFINGLSQAKLNKDYSVASKSLPYQKDYAGMIESIDQATSVSNMERNDYSVEVGNLSTKSAQLSPQTTITVKVSLQGDIAKLQKFLQQLSVELPLSEVVSIEFNENSASIEVNFFYKYLSPKTSFPYTDPVKKLNQNSEKLLRDLTKWMDDQNSISAPIFLPTQSATPSGV